MKWHLRAAAGVLASLPDACEFRRAATNSAMSATSFKLRQMSMIPAMPSSLRRSRAHAANFASMRWRRRSRLAATLLMLDSRGALDQDYFRTRSINFKFHAFCYGTHGPIERALGLRAAAEPREAAWPACSGLHAVPKETRKPAARASPCCSNI